MERLRKLVEEFREESKLHRHFLEKYGLEYDEGKAGAFAHAANMLEIVLDNIEAEKGG